MVMVVDWWIWKCRRDRELNGKSLGIFYRLLGVNSRRLKELDLLLLVEMWESMRKWIREKLDW